MPLAALLLPHCQKANQSLSTAACSFPLSKLHLGAFLEMMHDDKWWCETKLDLKSGRSENYALRECTTGSLQEIYARTCAIWARNLLQTLQVPFLKEHIHIMVYPIVWIYTAPIYTWNTHITHEYTIFRSIFCIGDWKCLEWFVEPEAPALTLRSRPQYCGFTGRPQEESQFALSTKERNAINQASEIATLPTLAHSCTSMHLIDFASMACFRMSSRNGQLTHSCFSNLSCWPAVVPKAPVSSRIHQMLADPKSNWLWPQVPNCRLKCHNRSCHLHSCKVSHKLKPLLISFYYFHGLAKRLVV